MVEVASASPGLRVEDLAMTYRTASRPVFSGLTFDLQREGRLAILGRNGQGKSTLIRILGGVTSPTSGRLQWSMSSSWPIGFGGGFQGSLTGLDNIRFISRLYDKPFAELRDHVDDFAELGLALFKPVKHYSSGMRARLAFGLSLAIEFDCYLVDEVVAVGDARFQQKCRDELFDRRKHRAYMLASHHMELVREQCDSALLIEGGRAKLFDNVDEAVDIYQWLRAN